MANLSFSYGIVIVNLFPSYMHMYLYPRENLAGKSRGTLCTRERNEEKEKGKKDRKKERKKERKTKITGFIYSTVQYLTFALTSSATPPHLSL